MLSQENCRCGLQQSYSACCGQYIETDTPAPTPEALMRSRFVAYTQANVDYIEKTMQAKALENFDKDNARQWARQVTWLDLQVLHASDVKQNKATVEFIARYTQQKQPQHIHERSEFMFENGRWFYVDGETLQLGRNDPCYCGSGKKYKKCCLNQIGEE